MENIYTSNMISRNIIFNLLLLFQKWMFPRAKDEPMLSNVFRSTGMIILLGNLNLKVSIGEINCYLDEMILWDKCRNWYVKKKMRLKLMSAFNIPSDLWLND